MVVTALKDVQARRGATRPHVLACDDGNDYVVKFHNGTRAAVNEYVGHAVANYLGLPVPPSQLVVVPRRVIDASDELKRQGVAEGIHQGTLLLEGSVNFRRIRTRNILLENSGSLPGIPVFDNFVMNPDRNNADNNLLVITPSGGLAYRGVDFDEILAGPRWTIETMNLVKASLIPMPVFPIIGLSVTGPESFSPWLERVESISRETLEEMLSTIPSGWGIGRPELQVITDFLLTRKTLVRRILLAGKSQFPRWNDDHGYPVHEEPAAQARR